MHLHDDRVWQVTHLSRVLGQFDVQSEAIRIAVEFSNSGLNPELRWSAGHHDRRDRQSRPNVDLRTRSIAARHRGEGAGSSADPIFNLRGVLLRQDIGVLLEARQLLDAAHPGLHIGIRREVDGGLFCVGHVTVDGDIGHGDFIADQE